MCLHNTRAGYIKADQKGGTSEDAQEIETLSAPWVEAQRLQAGGVRFTIVALAQLYRSILKELFFTLRHAEPLLLSPSFKRSRLNGEQAFGGPASLSPPTNSGLSR